MTRRRIIPTALKSLSAAGLSLRGGLRVVLYHHLSDLSTPYEDRVRLATPTALFEAHLIRLARDYEVVDLDQVLSGRLPKRALLITFDDGYRSVRDVGGPILKRLGLPSVFFISPVFVTPGSFPLDNLLSWLASRIGERELEAVVTGEPAKGRTLSELSAYIAELPYAATVQLGDQLAERFAVDRARLRQESGLFLEHAELPGLADYGFEVGNHTRSHVFCRSIVDEAAAETELIGAKRQLEEWTGRPVRSFSYPHGYRRDATPFVERMLARSGHETTFLVESRTNRPGGPPAMCNRVSLHDRPVSRLGLELEVLPRLRVLKDRVSRVVMATS